MRQKKAVTKELKDRYQRASKKEKASPLLRRDYPGIREMGGGIKLSTKVREKLFKISAATIDRLLSETRKRHRIKGRSS